MHRLVAALLLFISTPGIVWAKSIVIGQIQYLGTNAQGVSAFKVTLNTAGVTESPVSLANVVLIENNAQESTGPLSTPVEVLFLGAGTLRIPPCPCKMLSVSLTFKTTEPTLDLRLTDGEWFTARRVNWSFLRPLPGQPFLVPGQVAPITLSSVPEPWEQRPSRPLTGRSRMSSE